MNSTLLSVVWMFASMIVNLDAAEPSNPPNSADQSERNQETVLNYLLDVANSCRKPIRIYYSPVCSKDKSAEFPSVAVQRPGKGKTGLDAVREIFAKDKKVKVTEDGGVIRVSVGNVPTEILQAKLGRFSLTPDAQYSPGVAFRQLLQSKEMLKAEQSLKYRPPVTYSNSVIYPDEKLPHLPATIEDTTAEQFLDRMAKTWAGEVIVVYGACDKKDEAGVTDFWLDWAGQIGGGPK